MNKKKIIFTFVGLITLLISIIGVTTAYFIATITGNDEASSLIVEAARLTDLEYLPGEQINFDNVLPGWSASQTFSVRTKNAHSVPITYKVILNWSNSGITDMEYLLTSTSGDVTVTPKPINTVSENEHSVIATATFPTSESIQTHDYNLTLRFRETAVNQDEQQGKSFNAVVTIVFESGTTSRYYSSDYPNGTDAPWQFYCDDESRALNCKILADNTTENGKFKGEVSSDNLFKYTSEGCKTDSFGSNLDCTGPVTTGLYLENRPGKTENN